MVHCITNGTVSSAGYIRLLSASFFSLQSLSIYFTLYSARAARIDDTSRQQTADLSTLKSRMETGGLFSNPFLLDQNFSVTCKACTKKTQSGRFCAQFVPFAPKKKKKKQQLMNHAADGNIASTKKAKKSPEPI